MTMTVAPAKAGAASIQSAQSGSGPGLRRGDELGKAARQFEAIFVRQMIATMRAPSLGDELFGSDAANQFRDMSDARLADSMAGKFGIARMLEKQLAK